MPDAHTARHDTNATVNACLVDLGTRKSARDGAKKVLRKRMSGLNTELKQLLAGDVPRWNAFGLNRPDAVGLPDVPEGLTVSGGGPGHLLAIWKNAPLRDRYRIYRKIVGVDSDCELVRTVTEMEADVNSMSTGQVVRVRCRP